MPLSRTEQKALSETKKLIADTVKLFEKEGRTKLAKNFAKFGALAIRQFENPSKRATKVGERVACAIRGCNDFAEAKGYCRKDYQFRRRYAHKHGKPPSGWSENPKPQSIKREVAS